MGISRHHLVLCLGKKLINTKLKGDLSCLGDLLQECVSSRPLIIDFAWSTNGTRNS